MPTWPQTLAKKIRRYVMTKISALYNIRTHIFITQKDTFQQESPTASTVWKTGVAWHPRFKRLLRINSFVIQEMAKAQCYLDRNNAIPHLQ